MIPVNCYKTLSKTLSFVTNSYTDMVREERCYAAQSKYQK